MCREDLPALLARSTRSSLCLSSGSRASRGPGSATTQKAHPLSTSTKSQSSRFMRSRQVTRSITNFRRVLDECWPDVRGDLYAQMRRTWKAESYLCSTPRELDDIPKRSSLASVRTTSGRSCRCWQTGRPSLPAGTRPVTALRRSASPTFSTSARCRHPGATCRMPARGTGGFLRTSRIAMQSASNPRRTTMMLICAGACVSSALSLLTSSSMRWGGDVMGDGMFPRDAVQPLGLWRPSTSGGGSNMRGAGCGASE